MKIKKFCPVWTFIPAMEVTKVFATGGTGICTFCIVQACESNAPIDGTHFKEKCLHISAHLEIANFLASNGWISRFKKRHNIAYRNLLGESMSVDSETVEDWNNYQLLQDICDINDADETGLFFCLQPSKPLTFRGHFCHGGTSSKQWVTVLMACNQDGSDKLPLQ
jgi:hypothetical protein